MYAKSIMVNAGSLSKEKYLLGKSKRDRFRPGFELTVAAASIIIFLCLLFLGVCLWQCSLYITGRPGRRNSYLSVQQNLECYFVK